MCTPDLNHLFWRTKPQTAPTICENINKPNIIVLSFACKLTNKHAYSNSLAPLHDTRVYIDMDSMIKIKLNINPWHASLVSRKTTLQLTGSSVTLYIETLQETVQIHVD